MGKKRTKKKSYSSPPRKLATPPVAANENYASPAVMNAGMEYVSSLPAAFEHGTKLTGSIDGKLLRLLAAGAQALSDSDYLELMLAPAIPAKARHAISIRLLERFGTFKKVVHAERGEISHLVPEYADDVCHALQVMRMGAQRLLKNEIDSRPVIQSWSKLMEYLKLSSGQNRVEEFRIIFLNHRHALIQDEVVQRGTINHTPVYPREIAKRALELSAAAVILVHNHPSNDPQPSKADIDMTTKIIEALAVINVTVHDHVIVSESHHYSFRSFGLMGDPVAAPAEVTIPAGYQYSLPL